MSGLDALFDAARWAELAGTHGLDAATLAQIFGHYLILSLLAVGGAITTAPDMQRYLVQEHGWLSDAQFSASIGLAQAAPGPNILFVAVLGWNVAGLAGLLATMAGIMLPSSVLALAASRWLATRRETFAVRVFTGGLAPLTIGLLGATGWILAAPVRGSWAAWVLMVGSVVAMLRSKISPMWLIGLGALAGALGLT
ncbi:MAG TPA: chromate transporter [Burkholderiaceae bacterium]|nr:chromate transporter [Burkholderiaceae bacterium]HMX10827.1 chromate transporter [Burkholderiaceae bacterium]HMZ00008.1 chromate transporter [Burkholderiaceae bacterium]HNB43836.1 chromate transporter [Burkholderiaceae bacterium]HNG79903.1 chromate transporter [Burkholderiaceae bacterium]